MADPAFRSALEAAVAAQLEAAGVPYGYEVVKLDYRRAVPRGICSACGGTKVARRGRYLADFTNKEGTLVVEVKGYFHATDRAKMLAVRDANPGIEIRFLFGADNRVNKKNDKRYSDWCNQHNFRYAVRIIPKSWLKQFQLVRRDERNGGVDP